MNGWHVLIILLFALAGWLIWPQISRQIDAFPQRELQRVDAERDEEFERWRRSL